VVLGEFGEQLIVSDWHTSGGLNIPTVGQRTSFYGVSGIPHVRIDGKYAAVGASSCTSAAATYRNYINTRLNETGGLAPVQVEGVYGVDAGNLTMQVMCTLVDAVTLQSPRVYLVVLEDDVLHQGVTYQHIVRAEYHQDVSLPTQGSSVMVSSVFPVGPTWNVDNIECVAFIQKMTGDKEMYNSAHIPLFFVLAWEQTLVSVPQGNGLAEFTGLLTNTSDDPDQLTLTLDNTFGWPAEFMVEGEAGYHTSPSIISLNPQDAVEVYMRVQTDGEVRIGQGNFNVHSALTDRTQYTSVRVFNGSPAVLLVDDDNGIQPTEQGFVTALNANGYLFDSWDVKGAHGGAAPEYDDIKSYDLIVWITGWETYQPVTPADGEALMDFMDQGKGVFISAQDLTTAFPVGHTFLVDYLGVGSYTTNVRADQAIGVAGDPIGDGLSLTLTYPLSSVNRADEFIANAIGTQFMNNEIGRPIAVRADNGTARSVVLGFAGEAIVANPNPDNCTVLLGRALEWIYAPQGQGVEEREVKLASHIGGISPNPLSFRGASGEAAIRLRLSDHALQSPVRVDILDLNGRLVRNVLNTTLANGVTAAAWSGLDASGRPVSSGVYYARLTTSEGTHSARMVVMR